MTDISDPFTRHGTPAAPNIERNVPDPRVSTPREPDTEGQKAPDKPKTDEVVIQKTRAMGFSTFQFIRDMDAEASSALMDHLRRLNPSNEGTGA